MIELEKYGYAGDKPRPKFNTQFYTGDDKYSDGDIEDEVLKIIAGNSNTDYEEAISNNYSWPVFYHLTKMRQNLLNWYPFEADSEVLEIGCGMGAITELLCKRCKSVTAVELSERRATAAYLRCREYDNLEIIVGNLNDIEFQKKYDYITLIGVLEYQNNFTSSSNPYKDFLSKIKQLLKPDGKLIVAIENKYGLKYWCGAPEDHSGIPFDGINDYTYSNVARTFSKKQLKRLLESSGFNNTYFYYPMPDYKMPQVVYSQDYLPKNGSIDSCIPYYEPNGKSMISNEQHIYGDLIDNDVFDFFANSFMVECSVNNVDLGKIQYAVSSPFRNKEYSMITVYSKDNGYYKIADNNSLAALKATHINHKHLKERGLLVSDTNIVDNIMYTKKVEGIALTELLMSAYIDGKEKEVYDIWDKIFYEIKRSSEESSKLNAIFNSSSDMALSGFGENDKVLKNIYVDMIHKNCFVQENGDYVWIDQEWCLNDIPASFGLFYNIIELYSDNKNIEKYIPMSEVIEHYNLQNKFECYYNLKQVFLNTVQNKYSAFNYRQLSEMKDDDITKNIRMLYDNMHNHNEKQISKTEEEIDRILQNGTIMDVIQYVGSLSDEIILKDVPEVPQFIVRYLNADDNVKKIMQQQIKEYKDIKNLKFLGQGKSYDK